MLLFSFIHRCSQQVIFPFLISVNMQMLPTKCTSLGSSCMYNRASCAWAPHPHHRKLTFQLPEKPKIQPLNMFEVKIIQSSYPSIPSEDAFQGQLVSSRVFWKPRSELHLPLDHQGRVPQPCLSPQAARLFPALLFLQDSLFLPSMTSEFQITLILT